MLSEAAQVVWAKQPELKFTFQIFGFFSLTSCSALRFLLNSLLFLSLALSFVNQYSDFSFVFPFFVFVLFYAFLSGEL